MSGSCGVLFTSDWSHPKDAQGCRLQDHHDGPHEFVAEDGSVWQWETDWECNCDWCQRGEGDWCCLFWKIQNPDQVKATR